MTGLSYSAPLDHRRNPTVVIVGPCASGKSSLARELAKSGIPVRICGQEHSSIRELWRKLEPDVLVALAIDLPTLRERRHEMWPEPLYVVQQQRLASAFATADLVIDTTRVTPGEAADLVRQHLERGYGAPHRLQRPN